VESLLPFNSVVKSNYPTGSSTVNTTIGPPPLDHHHWTTTIGPPPLDHHKCGEPKSRTFSVKVGMKTVDNDIDKRNKQ
jgi:hypothetical protein